MPCFALSASHIILIRPCPLGALNPNPPSNPRRGTLPGVHQEYVQWQHESKCGKMYRYGGNTKLKRGKTYRMR